MPREKIDMTQIKVKVTEYKDTLVIETLKPEKDKDFIPVTEPGKVGSVLINTGKLLGISDEALWFMQRLRKSGDAIGDVDAWITADGRHCFSWLGNLHKVVMPDATLSKTGFQHINYIKIPNKPPKGAREAIDVYLLQKGDEDADSCSKCKGCQE